LLALAVINSPPTVAEAELSQLASFETIEVMAVAEEETTVGVGWPSLEAALDKTKLATYICLN